MARRQYSKSDLKKLLETETYLADMITKRSDVVEDDNLILIDNFPSLLRYEGRVYPHLKLLLKNINIIPFVTVDKGAIKFVTNGADIMRPGITKVSEFKKDDFVVIIDENYSKPLSVGIALMDSEEMKTQKNGKSVKNIHYIGDENWNK